MCGCKKKGKRPKKKCSCGGLSRCKKPRCMNIFTKTTLKRRGKYKRKPKVKNTSKYAFLI